MNVASSLAQTAARVPDRPALVFRGRPVTYAELDDAAGRAGTALAEHGVGPGDRVALLLGNVPEFAYALYGTWWAGAVPVPLNVMLTPEEVGYILADAGARAVIAEMAYLPTVLAVRDRLADLETILVVAGPPVPAGTVSFEQAMEGVEPGEPQPKAPEELALVQYTSGTTADPKGAMLTHGNLAANLEQMAGVESMRIRSDDVVLIVLPLFHIYALNVILGMVVREGATAVLVERFDPAETLGLVQRHGVTLLPGAPPMFVAWLALGEERREAFSSVRMAVSGAAPLPVEVFQRFRQRFGVTIWDSYGLTEAGPAVTTSAAAKEAKAGSIGVPLPGLEVRLVDEYGEDAEEGDPGEIVVRGPNVFTGYWQKDGASAEAFLEGEWLRTGDVAYRDEDGHLFLVDRKKDLVIVSGFNVFPHEVEDALLRDEAVAEAAVVGVPDPRTGEAVKAFVVAAPGTTIDPEALRESTGRYLARFKTPRDIEVVASLPRLATGKVLRRALRGEEVLGGPISEEAPGAADAGEGAGTHDARG